MPSATQELRDKMVEYFGKENELDPSAPMKFLLDNGWNEQEGILFEDKAYDEITQKEWDCCEFLCQEWDYDYRGGD